VTRAAYLLAVPGFADWEPAHALAELRRTGGYRVEVAGLTRDPVESMGGVRVTPGMALDRIDPADVAIMILPGGERWETGPPEPELIGVLRALDDAQVPIAAICGATVGVARAGLLRGRRHTSNGLAYLREQAPEYREAANYVAQPAVRDRRLITASGLADVEFAAEIFAELGVFSDTDRTLWSQIFRSGRLPAT
jgi:putative intracellular protease/amidase